MKRKILPIVVILMFLFTVLSPIQAIKTADTKTSAGLPDLTCDVEIVEIDGGYNIQLTVTNEGTATTNVWSVHARAYGPIAYLFYRLGINMSSGPFAGILVWIACRFDITFWPIIGTGAYSSAYPLAPGQSYTITSSFNIPINHLYPDEKFVIIIEGIADREKKVKESNEFNNRDIIRWWFPTKTNPPSS
jgi:hypothetical protein